jgi:GNAT superfamily N-acetyltransferase
VDLLHRRRRVEEESRVGDVRTVAVGPDDWKSWREIRLRSLRQDPDAFGSTYEREAAFTEQTWRSRLDGTSGPSVLAYAGDEVVGMVVAMWTAPDRRGQGIGRQVLDHVIGWAGERGLLVDLWVADGNPGARRLYERHGFRPDGRTAPIREGSEATMTHLVLPD